MEFLKKILGYVLQYKKTVITVDLISIGVFAETMITDAKFTTYLTGNIGLVVAIICTAALVAAYFFVGKSK